MNTNLKIKLKAKKEAKNIIQDTNKQELKRSEAIIDIDKPKIIALDVTIGVVIISIFIRFVVFPYILNRKDVEINRLQSVIQKYGKEIFSFRNIFFLILYIVILGIFFSFGDSEFKKIGLVLLISFITSIAVEAKLFVLGALISGLAAYIYIRVAMAIEQKKINKNKKDKSNLK